VLEHRLPVLEGLLLERRVERLEGERLVTAPGVVDEDVEATVLALEDRTRRREWHFELAYPIPESHRERGAIPYRDVVTTQIPPPPQCEPCQAAHSWPVVVHGTL
jgi:hypothetical protein